MAYGLSIRNRIEIFAESMGIDEVRRLEMGHIGRVDHMVQKFGIPGDEEFRRDFTSFER